ncbi:MAG: TatD family hydrolase, partial [Bacilli bacterium]|nr:TatD family hydrolase [Bacilli bacterium]
MKYFDSHCHLNDEKILERIDEEISQMREAGISTALCIGYDLASSRKAIELAEKYPEVYASVGMHPENLEGETMAVLNDIRELARHPKVLAIGEIGLDYHWYSDPAVREAQKPW